ncbi:hypothetical protein EXIGLDRAFT_764328 [Exidia glandulosa HHB12029]|uniref:Secreted protein n=1 Tax=Exidia glandulosa HHB12029 TaxID=1314781 RepID=A0A165L908_EXIGL|nr:hypothetical protein EXIGLDRAFT_764328 [Exidia glandulosa HHB12029]
MVGLKPLECTLFWFYWAWLYSSVRCLSPARNASIKVVPRVDATPQISMPPVLSLLDAQHALEYASGVAIDDTRPKASSSYNVMDIHRRSTTS